MAAFPIPRREPLIIRGCRALGRAFVIVALLAPCPLFGQLLDHEKRELDGLRDFEERLAAVQTRAETGASVVIKTSTGRSESWVEVRREDLRIQIAMLRLVDELDPSGENQMRNAIFEGRRILREQLEKARARIHEIEKRDLPLGGEMATGPGEESWRMVLLPEPSGSTSHTTVTGSLFLTTVRDGTASGQLQLDGNMRLRNDDVSSLSLTGTVRDGRVRLREESNDLRTLSMDGTLQPSGRSASGTYVFVRQRGTWRATRSDRSPDHLAIPPAYVALMRFEDRPGWEDEFKQRLLLDVRCAPGAPRCRVTGNLKTPLGRGSRFYLEGWYEKQAIDLESLDRGAGDVRGWSLTGSLDRRNRIQGSFDHTDREGRKWKGSWTAIPEEEAP